MLNHEETCEEFAQVLNVKYDVLWYDGLYSAVLRYCPFCGANLKGEE